ncbi:MAG: hypothetical protein EBS35_07540 [Bacteroidetes bacterium]|nr:hypothetical protein [Bacteroidota bacterium]
MNLKFNLIFSLFFFLNSFITLTAQCSPDLSILNKSIPQLQRQSYFTPQFQLLTFNKAKNFYHLKNGTNPLVRPAPFGDIKSRPMAFFCRIEVILEKKNGVPIKFRIGDIDKVDQLEGKFSW